MKSQFFLLGVHRDHRLAAPLELLGAPGDVLELRIAIRVPGPLSRLAIDLQAIAQMLQHFAHGLMTDRVSLATQLGRQRAHALAGPAQWRHRMASGGRLHQLLQRRAQPRIRVRQPRPARTFAPHTMLRCHRHALSRIAQLLHSGRDRRTCQTYRPSDDADPSIPKRTSLRRSPQSAHLLVHHATKRLELLGNARFVVVHPAMLSGPIALVNIIC